MIYGLKRKEHDVPEKILPMGEKKEE